MRGIEKYVQMRNRNMWNEQECLGGLVTHEILYFEFTSNFNNLSIYIIDSFSSEKD
jgi:hypothetical protein